LEELLTKIEAMHSSNKDGQGQEQPTCSHSLCTHFTEPGLWYARYWKSTNAEEVGALPDTVKEVICRAKGGYAVVKDEAAPAPAPAPVQLNATQQVGDTPTEKVCEADAK
jgi:hypothetical protein